ncbi:MAG TPA: ABC transporter permease, partial [Gemmatimonadales bacterium]|nr:ABC transporter permease [Gemmatimonadales bacterium]
AFRSIARRPTFALIAIGLLAVGIGLATAAFDVVDGLLLQPPPFDQPERILVLSDASPARGLTDAALSYPVVVDVRASSHSLEAVSVVRAYRGLVTNGPPAVRASGARVSPEFFRVFGVKPHLGRPLLQGDETSTAERSIVLSGRAWQDWYGGQPSAIGRTLALDGVPYTLVGVMPAWFDYPTGAEYWIPFVPESSAPDRTSHYVSAVGRLAARTSVEQARVELRGIADQLAQAYPASDSGWEIRATPIHEFLVGDTRPQLALAGAAAVLVLLIACANVASLLLARGATRQAETAVRRALGASTGQLIRHVLAESLLLAFAGAMVGAISAQAVAGVLPRVVPGPIPTWVSFSVHLRTLGFVAAAAILSTIVAGTAPAVGVIRDWAPEFLGGRGTVSKQQRRMRQGIVVAQVAIATTLLAGAGLLGESLLRLHAVAPGFDPQGVVTAHVTLTGPRYTEASAKERFYADALAGLRALPGVQAAGAIDQLPLASATNRFAFTLEGEPRPAKGSEPVARSALITPGYLAALRIPLVRGRDIDAHDDAEHPRVALVSASWVREFLPGRDPIGQRFRTFDDRIVTIVGVVGDVRHDGLQAAGEPTAYISLLQVPAGDMTLVVRGTCDLAGRNGCDDGPPLASMVRRIVKQIDPSVAAYSVESMSDVVSQSLSGRRVGAILSTALALLALLLASAGIYGLMALHIALRRRDVSIRLVLGARPQDVRRRLVAEAVRLAAIGAALGLGIVPLGGRMIASLTYGVTPTHAPTLLLAAGIMVGVGALASWGPAARAAHISPASALRLE